MLNKNVTEEENSVVCKACGKKKVDPSIPGSDFCDLIMCDFCHSWYHDVCVTGNMKTHRGMGFKCPPCRESEINIGTLLN